MKEIIHEMIFLKNLKLIDESKTLITVLLIYCVVQADDSKEFLWILKRRWR